MLRRVVIWLLTRQNGWRLEATAGFEPAQVLLPSELPVCCLWPLSQSVSKAVGCQVIPSLWLDPWKVDALATFLLDASEASG